MNTGNWHWAQWVMLSFLICSFIVNFSKGLRAGKNQDGINLMSVPVFILCWAGGFWS